MGEAEEDLTKYAECCDPNTNPIDPSDPSNPVADAAAAAAESQRSQECIARVYTELYEKLGRCVGCGQDYETSSCAEDQECCGEFPAGTCCACCNREDGGVCCPRGCCDGECCYAGDDCRSERDNKYCERRDAQAVEH